MGILYKNEHLNCFNYDSTSHPQIEVMRIDKEANRKVCVNSSEIIFILEGRSRYCFAGFEEQEIMKGEIFFLPAGSECVYSIQSTTVVMRFRLYENIQLCPGFQIEKLYNIRQVNLQNSHNRFDRLFKPLEISPRIWQFLDGVNDCLADGIKCRSYFDLKTKELFLLLRSYYPKEQLHDFFFLILSPDTSFSEYIRQNWSQYPTVTELAASIPLSLRQFNKRFKQTFGTTPYKWMKEGKAQHILREITSTSKSYKQIALENGFSTVQQFTKFCNSELGKTPTGIRYNKKDENVCNC